MRAYVAAMSFLVAVFAVSCTSREEGAVSQVEDEYRFEEVRIPLQGGITLFAKVVGHGRDTVIIPAAMYLANDFRPLVHGRTLIFYDPRGRGGSDYVGDPNQLGIEFDVADLEAVRQHFIVDRFSVIGWSYLGAMVALYAAEHPEHVNRVVQIGPMEPRPVADVGDDPRGSTPDAEALQRLAQLRDAGIPETDPVAYCREWLRLELLPSVMGKPETVANTQMDPCIYRNEWPDRVFETLGMVAPSDWDYTDRAALVQAPVLTVHGTADPSAAIEGGRDWASLFPNARILELEGIGHLPFVEDSQCFFTEVDAFLRGS